MVKIMKGHAICLSGTTFGHRPAVGLETKHPGAYPGACRSTLNLVSSTRRSPRPNFDGALGIELGTFFYVGLLPCRLDLKRVIDG